MSDDDFIFGNIPDDASGIDSTESLPQPSEDFTDLLKAMDGVVEAAATPCAIIVIAPSDDPDDPTVHLAFAPEAYPDAALLSKHVFMVSKAIFKRHGQINEQSSENLRED